MVKEEKEMINMDEFTTIKLLHKKGKSIRQIAKDLKISRNTVKKYLKSDNPPAYNSNRQNTRDDILFGMIKSTKSKWEKYREDIVNMYYNKNFIGSRIYEELKKKNADGSLSGFYQFFKRIKENNIAKKVRARFETAPGKQSQYDWSDYKVQFCDGFRKVYVHHIILCWSRYKYFIGSYNKNQASIFCAIEKAFNKFGGVTEELLTDNAMQLVRKAAPNNFEYNQEYLRFMHYYGVEPRVCKIRHSWTKGKVENPFYYLEQHFIKGNVFIDLDDFNQRLEEFTDNKFNRRHHTGINDIPFERYKKEKEYLKSLPVRGYVGDKMKWVKVRNDCLISFGGNKYSVPYIYAFNHVWLKEEFGDKLMIYSQKGNLIAEHRIPAKNGQINIKKEHYEGLNKKNINNSNYLKQEFLNQFKGYENYLESIIAQKRNNWKRHINKILELIEIYKVEDIKEGLKTSINYNVYSYEFILGYMREHYDINYQDYLRKVGVRNEGIQLEFSDIRRSLKEYEEVI